MQVLLLIHSGLLSTVISTYTTGTGVCPDSYTERYAEEKMAEMQESAVGCRSRGGGESSAMLYAANLGSIEMSEGKERV